MSSMNTANTMRHDLAISQSIEVNAPVTKVWEALTNPAIIKDYLFGTETITDWKPGSEIIFQGEWEGNKYRDHGKILENIPGKKISYSYWTSFSGLEDKPENYATITYTIEKIDEQRTRFTWTQKGYANENGYNHSLNGMVEFLASVKGVMER